MEKKVTAIVLMAGNSSRFGQNRNKNLEKLNGIPVIIYSLDAFDKNSQVDNIVIVLKESEKSTIENLLKDYKLTKDVQLVVGGNSRQESVFNALEHCESADIVIIHDGARPLIRQQYIHKCINSMQEFKGSSIAVKSKDTIKIADENGIVKYTTNRENTWQIQTPQCFDRKILLELHKKYKKVEGITDDCRLLELGNYPVKLIEGDYSNIKITTFDDIQNLKIKFKGEEK